jgi:hypothetical protein
MKQIAFLILFCLTASFSTSIKAENLSQYYTQNNKATITFTNKSDYSMVVKIICYSGGLYQAIDLPPHSSRKSSFNKSATYKIKIKATPKIGYSSYHDGGDFSVTCTDTEWSEGEMTFQMSSYGSGLGPSISEKEFESNY